MRLARDQNDQQRNEDLSMRVHFQKKYYSFLEETGIMVEVKVNKHPVMVKALVLKPEVFGTAPIYFLTTDISENDHLARTMNAMASRKLPNRNSLARALCSSFQPGSEDKAMLISESVSG